MKILFIKILLILIFFNCQHNEVYGQYCIPNPTYGTQYGTYIDGVQLGTNINTGTGNPADTNYTYYTWPATKTNLLIGSQNTLKVTAGSYYSQMHYVAWIDYNNNGEFTDDGEKLGEVVSTSANQVMPIIFTIPSGVETGVTRLRVRCVWNYTNPDPCTDYSYGETEDYMIYLTSFSDFNLGFEDNYGNYALFNYNNDADLDILNYNYSTWRDTSVYVFRDLGSVFDRYLYFSGKPPSFTYDCDFTIDDFNNDNYLDAVFAGRDQSADSSRTEIYQRNAGAWKVLNTNTEPLQNGALASADFNNDGLTDIIVSGINNEGKNKVLFYKNYLDSFSVIDPGLPEIKRGSIKCADYDRDGDIDFLISGIDKYSTKYSLIYKNNSNWQFSKIQVNLPQVEEGVYDWGDYDNDGDYDIVFVQWEKLSVFKNIGDDVFEEIIVDDEEYIGLGGHVKWGDMNNDGLTDIVCSSGSTILVYTNTGENSFVKSELFHVPSLANDFQYFDLGDYDNDNKLDIFTVGDSLRFFKNNIDDENIKPIAPTNLMAIQGRPEYYAVTLYWSPGSDDLVPSPGLSYNLRVGSSPGASDIMSPTSTNSNALMPRVGNVFSDTTWVLYNLSPGTYYWNVQTVDNAFLVSPYSAQGSFTIDPPLTPSNFVANGTFVKACPAIDYDTDGDLDILIDSANHIHLFNHNGSLDFNKEVLGTGIDILAVSDFLANNKPDFVIETNDSIGVLYNKGDNTFLKHMIDTTVSPSVCINDFNNDGKNDILAYNAGSYKYFLYTNNGALNFNRTELPMVDSIIYASIACADFDNDNNPDIIIAGNYFNDNLFSGAPGITKVYHSNGKGDFTEKQLFANGLGAATQISLSGFFKINTPPNLVLKDYNLDGYVDLIVTGQDEYKNVYTRQYKNNKNGLFTQVENNLRPTKIHQLNWFDYNADGYIDIITPKYGSNIDFLVYLNQQNQSYKGFSTALDSISNTFYIDMIDINTDGEYDVIFCKKYTIVDNYRFETHIQLNSGNLKNNPPTLPVNQQAEIDSFTVSLLWDKSVDDFTGNEGISYNIYIGTEKGKTDIVSPLADTENGKPFIKQHGNCGFRNSYTIKGLEVGKYYWAIQAVDNGYNYSSWTAIDSFIVSSIDVNIKADTVCKGNITTFTDNSVVAGDDNIVSWKWDFGDGTSSLLQNPYHTYQTADTFEVTLKVFSSSGDSAERTLDVFVLPVPKASFTVAPVCIGEISDFQNTSDTSGISVHTWQWDFGNTKVSGTRGNETQTYIKSDTAILTILAYNGCWDADTQEVVVAPYPNAIVNLYESKSSFCQGENATLLVVNYNSQYNYQWKNRGSNITVPNDSAVIVSTSGSYSVLATNPVAGCTDISDEIKITVQEKPGKLTINNLSGSDSICLGDSIQLKASGANEFYTFDWLVNTTSRIDTQQITWVRDAGSYQAKARYKNDTVLTCWSILSDPIVITVNLPPQPIEIKGAKSVCQGDSVLLHTTKPSNINLTWYNTQTETKLGTNDTLTVYEQGDYYIELMNAAGCINYSNNTATVNLFPKPTPPLISSEGNNPACQGETITLLNLLPTEGSTYQWFKDNTEYMKGSSITLSDPAQSGTYKLLALDGLCISDTSNAIDLTINQKPNVPVIEKSLGNIFCNDTSDYYQLSSLPQAGVNYQWYMQSGKLNGKTGQQLRVTESGTYYLVATNAMGCSQGGNALTSTVYATPGLPLFYIQNNDSCPGSMGEFVIENYDSNYVYQLYINGNFSSTLEGSNTWHPLYEKQYQVRADNQGCADTSNTISLTMKSDIEPPNLLAFGPYVPYIACTNDSAWHYKWYYDGSPVLNENDHVCMVQENYGLYTLSITDARGCTVSDSIYISDQRPGKSTGSVFSEAVSIHPNPNPGAFTITIEGAYRGNVVVHITDLNGRVRSRYVYDKNSQTMECNIQHAGLSKGLYLLKIDMKGLKLIEGLMISD